MERGNIMCNKTIKNSFLPCQVSLILITALGILTILASCGGGDNDSYIGDFWVPTDVIITDIDNDGDNDIIKLAMWSSKSDQGHLGVYRQSNNGTFTTSSDYIVGGYPWQLVVGDINNDGLPDLLATEPDSSGVWLILQDTDNIGKFLSAKQYEINGYIEYGAIDDLNSDGESEILISDSGKSSNRMVMLNNDPANINILLPQTDIIFPGAPSNIATGDLNGDGLTDLLTWVYLEPSGYTPNGVLAVRFQQPDGALGPVTTLAPQKGLNVNYLSIADYNGDGANDIFVLFTTSGDNSQTKFTVILQGHNPGEFGQPVDTDFTITGPDDAVIADLNGDGLPELATVGFLESSINLFVQGGNGTFSWRRQYDFPSEVARITAGDLDGDGLNDLAVLDDENEVYVLIQSHNSKGTFNSPELMQ